MFFHGLLFPSCVFVALFISVSLQSTLRLPACHEKCVFTVLLRHNGELSDHSLFCLWKIKAWQIQNKENEMPGICRASNLICYLPISVLKYEFDLSIFDNLREHLSQQVF
jgi:hypothetical protein